MNSLAGYIATAVISVVAGLVLQRLRDRPKVLYWIPGSFLFELHEPQIINLRTDSLTIQNVGRESASKLEIIHKAKPDHFQFSTAVTYSEETLPSGEHVIKIENLGPKEHINLQLMSHTIPPNLLQIRSSAGPAKAIQVQLQRVIPRWGQLMLGCLLAVGLAFSFYWIVRAIIFISGNIGVL